MKPRVDRELDIAVGQRLKQLRGSRGWTQECLAEKLGVEPVSVSRFETGSRSVGLPMLYRIAETLQVAPSRILPPMHPESSGESSAFFNDSAAQQAFPSALWDELTPRERALAIRLMDALHGS